MGTNSNDCRWNRASKEKTLASLHMGLASNSWMPSKGGRNSIWSWERTTKHPGVRAWIRTRNRWKCTRVKYVNGSQVRKVVMVIEKIYKVCWAFSVLDNMCIYITLILTRSLKKELAFLFIHEQSLLVHDHMKLTCLQISKMVVS